MDGSSHLSADSQLMSVGWPEGWRPPGAQSAVTVVMMTAPQTLSLLLLLLLLDRTAGTTYMYADTVNCY